MTQLGQFHANFFCHEMDSPVIDDGTGKVVNNFQKPYIEVHARTHCSVLGTRRLDI